MSGGNGAASLRSERSGAEEAAARGGAGGHTKFQVWPQGRGLETTHSAQREASLGGRWCGEELRATRSP